MKDFYKQKGEGTRKLYEAKKQIDYFKVTFLWRMAGVYPADYLLLIRGFLIDWFKISFLGELRLKLSLGSVMWGLAHLTPSWACLLFLTVKWYAAIRIIARIYLRFCVLCLLLQYGRKALSETAHKTLTSLNWLCLLK